MIVAEIGINHNGSMDVALEMIGMAAKCGVDAVKFQVFKAGEICERGIPYNYNGITEDMFAMFERHELTDWERLKLECDSYGVEFMATPMGIKSLVTIVNLGIKRIKVASSDLCNIPLLEAIEETGLPVIVSIGMGIESEIEYVGNLFGRERLIVAVCTSEYPTPPEAANLGRIQTIRDMGFKVGFSDHTEGAQAASIATSYGCEYFEKHITLSHGMDGPDHRFSSDYNELREWVSTIEAGRLLMGSGLIEPTEKERGCGYRKTAVNGYVRRK